MRSDGVKISPFVRDAAREGTTFATVDIPALLSNARAQHASTGTDIGMACQDDSSAALCILKKHTHAYA